MDNLNEADLRVAKINTSGLQNFRRDTLWKDANIHSRNGQYNQWNEDLDAIWRELVGSVKPSSTVEKEFFEINSRYAKTISPIRKSNGFNSIKPEDFKKLIIQRAILMQKETFLRRLEDNQGKGTAYDDSEDEETE